MTTEQELTETRQMLQAATARVKFLEEDRASLMNQIEILQTRIGGRDRVIQEQEMFIVGLRKRRYPMAQPVPELPEHVI